MQSPANSAVAGQKRLFLASFLTLIAAGIGFSIRNGILGEWGAQFGFTQGELGRITGGGLTGFGLTIIFFSFFADRVGYGPLMAIAFTLHTLSAVVTLAATPVFHAFGKDATYQCLYWGAFLFALGNGTCEAVINPLTATLYPKEKTHWLNILHAGWPGGLVLGALLGLVFKVGHVGWPVQMCVFLAPTFLYGLMMLGRRFPHSEARVHGVTVGRMLEEIGLLGAMVVILLLGLWLSSDVAKALGVPGVVGWLAALVLLVAFGVGTKFTMGHWVFAFLLVLHACVGYVELGTDSWIQNITGTILADPKKGQMLFIWTSVLMFALRFFAGPIVHKISPLGLLFGAAVLAAAGLFLLGTATTGVACVMAATVYGIGKTYYWPTMLGVASERFPRGGALALGCLGAVGTLSAGLLGGPGIGYKQDYFASNHLQESSPPAYARYQSEDKRSFLFFPPIAGLDQSKVATLNDAGTQLQKDIGILEKSGRKLSDDPNVEKLSNWWAGAKAEAATDKEPVNTATLHGGKAALKRTALVPLAMAVGYLLLILYFKARGGYKQVHIEEASATHSGQPPAPAA
ncbi:MAG TPA: MFS transporter [Verrucomicrobiae bacterium]|nr:MFS transporter [Verrucomicrobiae bacterium]